MREILNDKGTLTITCKTCDKPFSLTKEEQEWYRGREYPLPKNCRNCRKRKRAERSTDGHEPIGQLNITSDFKGF